MPNKTAQVDQFLLIHSARADNWREITTLADAWAANRGARAALEAAISAVAPAEEYYAYPGRRLLSVLAERIATDDAGGAARLARRISNGLLSHSYRGRQSEWDVHDEMSGAEVTDIMPPGTGEARGRRPYFEVLFVNSQPATRWEAFAAEIRRLRRPEDGFIYEPVLVGSFEDAFCAAALNPDIIAIVLAEGFPYRSRHDAPVLRSVLDPLGETEGPDMSALRLARGLKRIRPELDVYLLSDRQVEKIAGDPTADAVRRVFYAVE
ncbi:decarboxylase, partial [Ensifer sp. ENS02]|nr:decarboxylase [Ensifer sp. ENS02]